MSTTIEHDTQQPVEAVEAKTTTALAVVTKSIAEINAVEATVAGLEEKYRGVVFQVDTADGLKDACKVRAEIREPRYALQNMQKAAKATLNDLKRTIDDQAESLIGRISAVEDPIHRQIANEEERKKAEKKAREEAESKRVAAIEERISDIRETVTLAAGMSATEIAQIITELETVAIDAAFAEFQQRAETAKAATLVRLKAAHTAAVNLEAQQKKLEEERAELARQKVAEAERQAKAAADVLRVSKLRERIGFIRDFPQGASVMPASRVQLMLDEAMAFVVDSSFEELQAEAEQVLIETVQTLVRIHSERVEAEAESERLARQKAEQEAAAAKERACLAEEERQARVKREAEERAHQEHLQRQREEEERAAAERRRILEAEERAAQERLVAQRAEADRIEAERKAQREAEEQRLAEQRAELDRQQQALQLEKEAVTPASDPVEATFSESVLPPQPSVPTAHEAAYRPTDDEIIEAVAQAFFVPESTAVDWIAGMEMHQRQAEAA